METKANVEPRVYIFTTSEPAMHPPRATSQPFVTSEMCTTPEARAPEYGCPLRTCRGWLQHYAGAPQTAPVNLTLFSVGESRFPISGACFPSAYAIQVLGTVPLLSLRIHSSNNQQHKA